MNARVVTIKVMLSLRPFFFNPAHNQPRKKPSSVTSPTRIVPMAPAKRLIMALFQSVPEISIAPPSAAATVSNDMTTRGYATA